MLRLFRRCIHGLEPFLPHVTRRESTKYYTMGLLEKSPGYVDCFQGIIKMILFQMLGCILVRSTSCSYRHQNSTTTAATSKRHKTIIVTMGTCLLGLSSTLAVPAEAAAAAASTTTATPRGLLRAYQLYSKSRVGLERCWPCFMF
jgi:hypothetical protein